MTRSIVRGMATAVALLFATSAAAQNKQPDFSGQWHTLPERTPNSPVPNPGKIGMGGKGTVALKITQDSRYLVEMRAASGTFNTLLSGTYMRTERIIFDVGQAPRLQALPTNTL